MEKPTNETIAGGYYIGSDGKPHDANGNPIKEVIHLSGPSEKASVPESVTDDDTALSISPKGASGRVGSPAKGKSGSKGASSSEGTKK